MTRGYSNEADKMLNYLVRGGAAYRHRCHLNQFLFHRRQENGIFDALGKQYLRSFIFAIYLVSTPTKWVLTPNSYTVRRIIKIPTSECA